MGTPIAYTAGVLLLFYFVGRTSALFFQTSHDQYRCIPGMTLTQINNLTVNMADMTQFYDQSLAGILIPRIPDTPSHSLVRRFIENQMRQLGWTIELDSFDRSTPYGVKTFTNVIATLNPTATKRIVFACHYDSKMIQGNKPFLGATDSAVPCALLLDSAWKLKDFLQNSHSVLREDVTPQFIFFDGEEAFVRWTATDSLYGSRHLADKWYTQPDPNDATVTNNLDNIEFFVLLDLIGGSNMKFTDYFSNTSIYFYHLYQIEHCLRNSNILPRRSYQRPLFDLWDSSRTAVEDDHIPFIHKGVPILHLISNPFPAVWHTLNDDLDHLDRTVITEFAAIFRVFLFRLFSGDI